MAWDPTDIPDQTGRRILITGANAGIGYHAALQLAGAGATVTMACRSQKRGEQAANKIQQELDGQAELDVVHLDLSDLDQVKRSADRIGTLDVLVNNAGVMQPPPKKTQQGFELQWGVNVVGHYALTQHLLPRIQDRVVTIASIAHRHARIDFDNLRLEKRYRRHREYARSKLGNLVFALEQQRRLEAAGSPVRSIAAHPGVSLTRLGRHLTFPSILAWAFVLPFIQSSRAGAWPTSFAATQDVPGGSYIGPRGIGEWRGRPAPAKVKKHAKDPELGRRLWQELERSSGVAAAV